MSCPDDNELAQLVDGTLTAARRTVVERHLDACSACTHLVAELAWIVAPARQAPPGYRLTTAIDDDTWHAIDTRHDREVVLALDVAIDRAVLDVQHPNVARVYEVGESFVAYEPLVKRAPSTLATWQQALQGLAALHRAGVTHAVTPARVFVDGERVVIGFAHPPDRASGYLAREVLEGAPPTTASDQVAVCIAIYEALAGAKPFAGATVGALAVAMTALPEAPDFERRIWAVLARGLDPDPARRWPSIDALAAALARPPRSRVAVVAVAVAITVAAVVAALVAT
jgi:hypothetical protein